MASGFGESTSGAPQRPRCSSSNNSEASSFDCNICFDLAQDPIVTLCGHLFCWPCFYKWLHIHSQSQECPVCKALVEEEKLVPLYSRGKTSTDPRSKSIPGVNIPNRPAAQRPETAPPPEPPWYHPQHGFGFMNGLGWFASMATAGFGIFTSSAASAGLFPSLFNFQVHCSVELGKVVSICSYTRSASNLSTSLTNGRLHERTLVEVRSGQVFSRI